MGDIKVVAPNFVNLHISTSKNEISFVEKRFSKAILVSDLKKNLELITGGNCMTMKLEIYSKENYLICELTNNNALLGSYPVDSGMRLHVLDQFLLHSDFETDTEKYDMPHEEYAKKTDTVRSFLLKNKQGKYSDEYIKNRENKLEKERELAEAKQVGSRCKVEVKDAPTRLGTVMYTGAVEGLNGYWIGIKYDEPLGKNDGTCKGKRYFQCEDKYGAFVKPQDVICGDFPELDYGLDDEI